MMAIVTTPVNPTCIASSAARIALSTDAEPLIPQAQGIKLVRVCTDEAEAERERHTHKDGERRYEEEC